MTPKTHKTPQLMKLLTGSSGVINPIIDEKFKEDIIRSKENPEPVKPRPSSNGGTEVNVTSELISQWLPLVIKRFNLCSCDRCNAEMTVAAFDSIKPVTVEVRSNSDLKRAQEIKSSEEQPVLMQLIRLAIERKKLKRHDI